MKTKYMLKYSICTLLVINLIFLSCKPEEPVIEFNQIEVEYPTIKKDTLVEDDYHGTVIKDPYRWLEDDHSDETKEWVAQQNTVTFGYLDQIPYRDKIRNRLEKLWNYERYSSPFKEGGKFYYFKNDGLQNQSVMYVTSDPSMDGEVFLDPNKFSEDGTSSLGGFDFDKEGKNLAYQVSEGGSDWRSVKIMNIETGEMYDETLEWIKFSGISWSKDGFYYSRYPAPEDTDDKLSAQNKFHQVYYHKLGTDQSEDQLVYEDKENPQRNAYASTTDDERFLVLYLSESTSGNALKVKDLSKENSDFVDLISTFDNDFTVVENDEQNLLVMTNLNAPNQKVVSIDLDNPAEENWNDLIPESEDALRGVSIVGNRIFASYLHNAASLIKVYEMDGSYLKDLELPGIGSSGGISGKKSSNQGFYSFTSFIEPTSIYSLNTETLESEVFRKPNVDFDSDQYETKQLWYESYDGTKVPMFVTHKKGLELDGDNPTLLYGYGGFDIPILPRFNIPNLPLLENGGVYAVANIRGGGEFGKKWHRAGTLGEKQNVFDDFQAAAEYLISEKYTNSSKLAIEGRSNGGLLVGACMTQRPDLFAVAFPGVGVLDMLRYHQFTIGWAWAGDYGRSDDPQAFEYLRKYSPLHNIKKADYPATMVTTADHDDRVVPAHSFKFISELQNNHTGDDPVLIRVDVDAGHGAGKSTTMRINEAADMLSFMFYNFKEHVNFDVKN